MAKKSFKDAASASIAMPKMETSKREVETNKPTEKRRVTTILLKASLQKRFKMVCVEKDLKIGDEQEEMFLKWLKENED